jgi:hypothetical protein
VEVTILIMLPYFIAVIATIVYTNKETRKSEVGSEDSNKKKIAGNNNSPID